MAPEGQPERAVWRTLAAPRRIASGINNGSTRISTATALDAYRSLQQDKKLLKRAVDGDKGAFDLIVPGPGGRSLHDEVDLAASAVRQAKERRTRSHAARSLEAMAGGFLGLVGGWATAYAVASTGAISGLAIAWGMGLAGYLTGLGVHVVRVRGPGAQRRLQDLIAQQESLQRHLSRGQELVRGLSREADDIETVLEGFVVTRLLDAGTPDQQSAVNAARALLGDRPHDGRARELWDRLVTRSELARADGRALPSSLHVDEESKEVFSSYAAERRATRQDTSGARPMPSRHSDPPGPTLGTGKNLV